MSGRMPAATEPILLCAAAQRPNVDTPKSTLTIPVGKAGSFSCLGREHEVRAHVHSGTADSGARAAAEMHVNARELCVLDQDACDKDRWTRRGNLTLHS